jgi:mercuric ion transport protein
MVHLSFQPTGLVRKSFGVDNVLVPTNIPMVQTSTAESRTARTISIGAAVLAAIAASSCCVGPLLFATLGIAGAGAFAGLAAYRPYALAGAAISLGAGFWLTYRRRKVASDACGCPRANAGRGAKVALWVASLGLVLTVVAPSLMTAIFENRVASAGSVDPAARTEKAVLLVSGADCEACAAHFRRALARVGGFHDLVLDVRSQRVTVTYEPAPGRLTAYVAAIRDLGYEPSLASPKPTAFR